MSTTRGSRSNTPKLPYALVETLEDIRSDIEGEGFDSKRSIFRFNADMEWIQKEYAEYMPKIGPIIERMKAAGFQMANAQELNQAASKEFSELETEIEKLSRNTIDDDDDC